MRSRLAPRSAESVRRETRSSNGPTLTVGRASDRAEREADEFAAGLMRDLVGRPMSIQRRAHGAEADVLGGMAVAPDVDARIRRTSGGAPLSAGLRRRAEAHAGRDLTSVRVHGGAEAAELSEALEATAFTVGSNVFLGADAARPGTPAGDEVLSHELGHVVQQAGGTPSVQRIFGRSKKPKQTAGDQVRSEAAGTTGAPVLTMRDLEKNLATLESALTKLVKNHTTGSTDTQDAAYQLKAAAQRILDGLPDQNSKASAVLGRQYPAHVKRLQRIIDECQLIWDEHLVAMTKRKAGNIYLEAGRGGPAALSKLSGGARSAGFAELGARPTEAPADAPAAGPGGLFQTETPLQKAQARHDKIAGLRERGKAAGLSAGELAAIMTFSAQDYTYINPATANSRDWMRAANPDLIDTPNKKPEEMQELGESLDKAGVTARQRLDARNKDLDTMREEGSLHAGMAVQGLLQLPVWKGTLYRGEVITEEAFRKRFKAPSVNRFVPKAVGGKNFVPVEKTLKRLAISSASKDRSVANGFLMVAGPKVPAPKVQIIYEMEVTNGRDIEDFSLSAHEKEVATLPGAEFSVLEAENLRPGVVPTPYLPLTVLVKCKQIK